MVLVNYRHMLFMQLLIRRLLINLSSTASTLQYKQPIYSLVAAATQDVCTPSRLASPNAAGPPMIVVAIDVHRKRCTQ